jgi:triacylglycerol lipase
MDLNDKEAALLANFVEFAYNMFAAGGLTPPPDPGIGAAGFELVYYLNGSDFEEKEFYGYIARSKTSPGDVVLAIRGTEDAAEWLLDLLALPVPFTPIPDAGSVALGFLSIYDSFQLVDTAGAVVSLSDAITHLAASAPIQNLTVTGHSLGAALATLAAAELALKDVAGVQKVLTVYTFASPRVGLLDFAASFDQAVPTSFRVWNTLDIVPQVPAFPYIHVSGLGDAIVQTEQQLSTLVFSPACEHHLTSYQWLLDAADFPLDSDCTQATHPILTSAAMVGITRVRITGSARVLRRAQHGRV